MSKELKEILTKVQSQERMVLYTDSVNEKQTFRDDLWAVSTKELKQIESILTSQAAELKKMIEAKRKIKHDRTCGSYNQALDDVLSELNHQ